MNLRHTASNVTQFTYENINCVFLMLIEYFFFFTPEFIINSDYIAQFLVDFLSLLTIYADSTSTE